jgi:hypothetical protein
VLENLGEKGHSLTSRKTTDVRYRQSGLSASCPTKDHFAAEAVTILDDVLARGCKKLIKSEENTATWALHFGKCVIP